MNYKLMNPINGGYTTIEQVLTNRGMKKEDINHYLNTTDEDINDPFLLEPAKLIGGLSYLLKTMFNDKKAIIVVDVDMDGYSSAALLANYLYSLFPFWTKNNLLFFMHDGKQHGLEDFVLPEGEDIGLVICPDSASNDIVQHKQLKEKGIKVLVLDHHIVTEESEDAIVINSQLDGYPNPDLSGVGVVYQFCRCIDSIFKVKYADNFLDLVACGLQGDMTNIQSIETKHLIHKGFRKENIKNPFIYSMAKHNSFSLGDKITPMGASFYIVPFVNAMVRSGTMKEKQLLFRSMLTYEAFKEVPSTKRGCKGEMETVVEQAVRTCINVKARQKRAEDEGLALLEEKIEKDNLLQKHRILLFILDESLPIEKNIRGLIANRLAAKYQRPCCVLSEKDNNYQGSARGYSYNGIKDFNKICQNTGVIDYAAGHSDAFGISIPIQNLDPFLSSIDNQLKDMPTEPIYLVDYIFCGDAVDKNIVLGIGEMDDLWGQELPEPYVAIENLSITSDMVTLMSPDRRPTLKITLPNGIALIKFKSSAQEYEEYCINNYGEIVVNIIGTCSKNEWNGMVTPQILIKEMEIVSKGYSF